MIQLRAGMSKRACLAHDEGHFPEQYILSHCAIVLHLQFDLLAVVYATENHGLHPSCSAYQLMEGVT
jgi:hypothetical protein